MRISNPTVEEFYDFAGRCAKVTFVDSIRDSSLDEWTYFMNYKIHKVLISVLVVEALAKVLIGTPLNTIQ